MCAAGTSISVAVSLETLGIMVSGGLLEVLLLSTLTYSTFVQVQTWTHQGTMGGISVPPSVALVLYVECLLYKYPSQRDSQEVR